MLLQARRAEQLQAVAPTTDFRVPCSLCSAEVSSRATC